MQLPSIRTWSCLFVGGHSTLCMHPAPPAAAHGEHAGPLLLLEKVASLDLGIQDPPRLDSDPLSDFIIYREPRIQYLSSASSESSGPPLRPPLGRQYRPRRGATLSFRARSDPSDSCLTFPGLSFPISSFDDPCNESAKRHEGRVSPRPPR